MDFFSESSNTILIKLRARLDLILLSRLRLYPLTISASLSIDSSTCWPCPLCTPMPSHQGDGDLLRQRQAGQLAAVGWTQTSSLIRGQFRSHCATVPRGAAQSSFACGLSRALTGHPSPWKGFRPTPIPPSWKPPGSILEISPNQKCRTF